MDDNLSNKEQVEIFRKWVKEYGFSILFAVVLGLGINYGWVYYKKREARSAVTASILYDGVFVASSKNEVKILNRLTEKLQSKYDSSPYASLASLIAAKNQVENKQYAGAIKNLQWVVRHESLNGLKDIAQIRIARIQLQQNEPLKSLQTLKGVQGSSFSPMVNEVRGDVYMKIGKRNEAKLSYKKAQAGYLSNQINDPFLTIKLDQS